MALTILACLLAWLSGWTACRSQDYRSHQIEESALLCHWIALFLGIVSVICLGIAWAVRS